MEERGDERSPDLDEVRRLLFPSLSPEEGWARIDRAVEGAADEERWAAIEKAATPPDLGDELADRLRKLRGPRRSG